MLIPVKCFTCGKVLADKYYGANGFVGMVRQRKAAANVPADAVRYLTSADAAVKTPEGRVLDELGLDKVCCRRHMLTHVDIE